jgi:hypothetical protein
MTIICKRLICSWFVFSQWLNFHNFNMIVIIRTIWIIHYSIYCITLIICYSFFTIIQIWIKCFTTKFSWLIIIINFLLFHNLWIIFNYFCCIIVITSIWRLIKSFENVCVLIKVWSVLMIVLVWWWLIMNRLNIFYIVVSIHI